MNWKKRAEARPSPLAGKPASSGWRRSRGARRAAGHRGGRALEAERLRQQRRAPGVPGVGVDAVAHREEEAAPALDVTRERARELLRGLGDVRDEDGGVAREARRSDLVGKGRRDREA